MVAVRPAKPKNKSNQIQKHLKKQTKKENNLKIKKIRTKKKRVQIEPKSFYFLNFKF